MNPVEHIGTISESWADRTASEVCLLIEHLHHLFFSGASIVTAKKGVLVEFQPPCENIASNTEESTQTIRPFLNEDQQVLVIGVNKPIGRDCFPIFDEDAIHARHHHSNFLCFHFPHPFRKYTLAFPSQI